MQVPKTKKSQVKFKINLNNNFDLGQKNEHLSDKKCMTDRKFSKTHRVSNQNVSKSPIRQSNKTQHKSKQKKSLGKQKKIYKQIVKSNSQQKVPTSLKSKKTLQVTNKRQTKKDQILTTSPNLINKYQTKQKQMSKSHSKSRSFSKSQTKNKSKSQKKERSKSQISTERLNTCRSTIQKKVIKKKKTQSNNTGNINSSSHKQKKQTKQKQTTVSKQRSRSRIYTERSCYSPLKQKNIYKNSSVAINNQSSKKQTAHKHSKSNLQTNKKKINNVKEKPTKVKKKISKKDNQQYKTIEVITGKQYSKERNSNQNHKTIKPHTNIQNNNIKSQDIGQTVSFKKRKNIQIRTQLSDKKQSYFDQSLLKRLQMFQQGFGDDLKNCQNQIKSQLDEISQLEHKQSIQIQQDKDKDKQNGKDDIQSPQNANFLNHLKMNQNNTINSQEVNKIQQLLTDKAQLQNKLDNDNQQLKEFQSINFDLQNLIKNQSKESSFSSINFDGQSGVKIQKTQKLLTNFRISKQQLVIHRTVQNDQDKFQSIQLLRKQQEQKWKSILEELNSIKNSQLNSPQKIDEIIKESQKNINDLNQKSKIHLSKNYESPKKISQLMKRPRKSFQQQMENAKNISQKRLLKDLQIMQSFQNSKQLDFLLEFNSNHSFDPINKQKTSYSKQECTQGSSEIIVKKNNFFVQFQKQMEEYLVQNSRSSNEKDKTQSFENNKQKQIHLIQKVQNLPNNNQTDEHLFLYDFVETTLIQQFCQSLIKSKKMFHQVLLAMNKIVVSQNTLVHKDLEYVKVQKQIDLQKFQEYLSKRIQCNEDYCHILSKQLMRYLKQHHLELILKNINKSFGMKPLQTLKWMRTLVYGEDQNQQEQQQSESAANDNNDNKYTQSEHNSQKAASQQSSSDPLQPIISTEILQEFNNHQNEFLFQQITEQQYFFNHAIYNCLNDMLDSYRPFGQQGRPIIPIFQLPKIKSIEHVIGNVLKKFKQILSIRMGRSEFSVEEEPQQIITTSYRKLDNCISQQLQSKWKQCNLEDIMFQKKLVLAQHIIDEIFNEQVLGILTKFHT